MSAVSPPTPAAARGAPRPRPAPGTPGAAADAPPRRLAPYAALRRTVARWWEGRLPFTDTWTLTQGNVYILPTKAGVVYAATLLLMLLASINYQLNLGYVLTFLLAGSGLVSMHLTHGTLRGLTLRLRTGPPVYAGEPALLEVVFDNPGRQRHGVALHFHDSRAHGPSWAWTDVPALGQASAHVSIVPPRRGVHRVPTLVVETAFPFGLFRAWSLWRPAAHVLAYPRPEAPPPPLPGAVAMPGEQQRARRGAGAELDGVRAWRRGDRMRHIVWKKVARTGELVSRDTADSGVRELTLDWHATRCAGDEQRLSRLAAWVLAAESEGVMYRLLLPGRDLGSGAGDAHRRAALEALATWPGATQPSPRVAAPAPPR